MTGTETTCTYCHVRMRTCCFPAVCWACDRPEARQKREEDLRLRNEEIRRAYREEQRQRLENQ